MIVAARGRVAKGARGAGVAASALALVGCVRHLPPRPAPEARAPAVDLSGPVAPGHGRLVIDVVDGSTPVQAVQMEPRRVTDGAGATHVRFEEAPRLLCDGTPCVVDPAQGNLLLGFPVQGDPGAYEVELVHVGPEPTVYRRSLSQYHRTRKGPLYTTGIVSTSVGACALIVGAVLLPIGLDAEDGDGLTTAGGVSLGAGAALLAFGIWALRHEADTYRPGAATHFAPGAGPR